MLQRYERRSIEEQVDQVHTQLEQQYQVLERTVWAQLTTSEAARILQDMLERVNVPTFGMHVVRCDLGQMGFPHQSEYELVMDRAEQFYLHSMSYDLQRIENQEPLSQLSPQDVSHAIKEANRKGNLESSLMSQSYEGGDNVDLMKVFEGVRNYQKWHEGIKRQSLERLKQQAQRVESRQSLQKGFAVSSIVANLEKYNQTNAFQLFQKYENTKLLESIITVYDKLSLNKRREAFVSLKVAGLVKRGVDLQEMFCKAASRIVISETKAAASKYSAIIRNCEVASYTISQRIKAKNSLLACSFFSKLNTKSLVASSHYTEGFNRLILTAKRIGVKKIVQALDYPAQAIGASLQNILWHHLADTWSELRRHDQSLNTAKVELSNRVKGKILASLNKFQKEPISLKKTFSRWYLNTHETYFAKKIYNIWLQGNTSKFTVFMRLKNMVDRVHRQQISKEMKNLVKTLCEKFQHYESHCSKAILGRWIRNTRAIRKIDHMLATFRAAESDTHEQFSKSALEAIGATSRRKKAVKMYCSMYLRNYVNNRKVALERWSQVCNLKKQWGRSKLRSLLLSIDSSTTMALRYSLKAMQSWRQEGREKKKEMVRKALAKDNVFLQRFFQQWRTKAVSITHQTQTSKDNAALSLSKLSCFFVQSTIEDAWNRICSFADHHHKQQESISNSFVRIIHQQKQQAKLSILRALEQNIELGQAKKYKLVTSLVNSLAVKEKLAFLIMKRETADRTTQLKREKAAQLFTALEDKVKQNLSIFDRRDFVFKVLQKVLITRTNHIHSSLNLWKNLPERPRYTLRSKVVTLREKIGNMTLSRLAYAQNEFKANGIAGRVKKRRILDMMSVKCAQPLKKYFTRYHRMVRQEKRDQQFSSVTNLFDTLESKSKKEWDLVFLATSQWGKKAQAFNKLNQKLKKRVSMFLTQWRQNSRAMMFTQQLDEEKKKRCIGLFSKVLLSFEGRQTKRVIQTFHHNARIQRLQVHFLKKLCDSQAGKVIKGFGVWKNLPIPKNKERIAKGTKFQGCLQRMLVRNMKTTMNSFKDCHYFGNEKKKYCIRRLVAKSCSGIGQYFQRWCHNKDLINLFSQNRCVENLFINLNSTTSKLIEPLFNGKESANRKRSLDIVLSWWDRQKKWYLKQWYHKVQQGKLNDLNKRHVLKSLVRTHQSFRGRQLIEAIEHYKMKKRQIEKEKKTQKRQSLLKVMDTFEANRRSLMTYTVDKWKFNHVKGNFMKNRAFHRFLSEKIGEVHKYLTVWNAYAMKEKEKHKQQIVSKNMDHLFEILRANYQTFMARTREVTIKKNTLNRLFQAQSTKFKGFFQLWRQRVRELNILGEMDRKTKMAILERINKIAEATSTQAVISTIRKFHMNSKIQKVQRKFMERLLQTKSGKTIHAFNAWKGIPVANMGGKYKTYQKFYFRMEKFFKDRLKQVHSTFTETSDNGNLMKKQSILKLFEMTSLGIRRYYNRWTRLTKEKHILSSVNATFKALESAESALANQYMIVFQDERAYQIKVAAINKLIKASRGTTQNYLNIWRSNIKEYRLLMELSNEKKKVALQIFNKVLGNSTAGQVVKIIGQFHTNAKTTKVARAFFNRLMQTKSGKVLGFFNKLKSIPDVKMNKRKKKGIIFESRLNAFAKKRLQDTLLPLKDNNYHANTKKKFCLDKLARACMGPTQKNFLIWRNVVRQSKILNHTTLFERAFNNIENVTRANMGVITKNTGPEMQKKKALCRKLINNSMFVQGHAYMLWKEALHLDELNIEKKQHSTQNHLKQLISVFNSSRTKQTVEVISIFRNLLELRHLQQFDDIKNYHHQKAIMLHERLATRQRTALHSFIQALSSHNAAFKVAQKSQIVNSAFHQINVGIKKTTDEVYLGKEKDIVLNALHKIYSNANHGAARTLRLWREGSRMVGEEKEQFTAKKKTVLIALNRLLQIENQRRVKDSVNAFATQRAVTVKKKDYLSRMLKTRAGQVYRLFSTWKQLPWQQTRKFKDKAVAFEAALRRLRQSRLGYVHSGWVENLRQGRQKKTGAMRYLTRSKLTDMGKGLFKWRQFVSEQQVKDKIVAVENLMCSANSAFRQHFELFGTVGRQQQRKDKAISALFNHNVNRLQEVFSIWRQSTRAKKLARLDYILAKYHPQIFNGRLLALSFDRLVGRSQGESLKGYINSLWKWKMSNMQATYYTKFIRVFKESEELMNMGQLLGRRLQQQTQYAFSAIRQVGQTNFNHKQRIVEKYLTRRARNYFLAFRNATQGSTINIWKSKFTDTIKATVILDAVSAVVRKSKADAWNILAANHHYNHKTSQLVQTLTNYSEQLTKFAFRAVRYQGHQQLLGISLQVYEEIKHKRLRDTFNRLNSNRKVQRLIDSLEKIEERTVKSEGIIRIRQRKQRVTRATLSINLLSCLLAQEKSRRVQGAIHKINHHRLRSVAAGRIQKVLSKVEHSYLSSFFKGGRRIILAAKLLQRFRGGQAVKRILDRQDEALKRKVMAILREKQNKWMDLAIRRLATRAAVRSSPAVALWRLRSYAQNS